MLSLIILDNLLMFILHFGYLLYYIYGLLLLEVKRKVEVSQSVVEENFSKYKKGKNKIYRECQCVKLVSGKISDVTNYPLYC